MELRTEVLRLTRSTRNITLRMSEEIRRCECVASCHLMQRQNLRTFVESLMCRLTIVEPSRRPYGFHGEILAAGEKQKGIFEGCYS